MRSLKAPHFALFFRYYIVFSFINAVFGDNASYRGYGVNAGVSADNSAGVKHTVAADFNKIAQNSADFFSSCWYLLFPVFNDNEGLITLYVGSN